MTLYEALLTSPWIGHLGWMLVNFLWQGAVVGAALLLALLCLRHHAAAARHAACIGALALMALFPVATLTMQTLEVELSATVGEEGDHSAEIPEGSVAAGTQTTEEAASPAAVGRSAATSAQGVLPGWLPWIVLGWLVGVCTLSLRLLGGWVHIEVLRRRMTGPVEQAVSDAAAQLQQRLGITRAVSVLTSALAEGPMTFGFLRPIVLLPGKAINALTPAQLEGILAHELAHICRNDFLTNLFLTLIETLFFFHPAVWWAARRTRIEREFCCDDLAAAAVGNHVDYARALADLESLRHQAAPDLAAAAVGQGLLLQRIRRLVAPHSASPQRREWLWGALTAAVVAILCVGTLHMTGVRAQETTPPRADAQPVEATPLLVATDPAPPLPPETTAEVGGVALLDFDRVGADETLRDAVGQLHALVNAGLAETPGLRLVDRSRLDAALAELRLGSSGLVDAATAAQLGKIVGAQTLIDGKLMRLDDEWVFTGRLVDSETTEMRGLRVTGKTEDGLLDLGDAVTTVLARRIQEIGSLTRAVAEDEATSAARIASVRTKLKGRTLPRIAVRVPEVHIGTVVPDPAGENEYIRVLRALGFTVVDVDALVPREQSTWWMDLFFGAGEDGEGRRGGLRQGWQDPGVILHNTKLARLKEKADLFVMGEAFSEFVSDQYGFNSCQARVEVKVLDTASDAVAAANSQHATAADLGEFVAAKKALRQAGGALALKMAEDLASYWETRQTAVAQP